MNVYKCVFVILYGVTNSKKRSDLIGISEKQGTYSRTKGFVEKGKIAFDN